jgi:hypothetical protein
VVATPTDPERRRFTIFLRDAAFPSEFKVIGSAPGERVTGLRLAPGWSKTEKREGYE